MHTDDTDGDDGLRYSTGWTLVNGTTESGLHCTLVPMLRNHLVSTKIYDEKYTP